MARAHVDVAALYAALNKEREARGLSWRTLAAEVEISPSTLSRMANGRPPHVDAYAALTAWLGTSPEAYTVTDLHRDEPDLLTELAPLLRARKDLDAKDVEYLEDLIGAAIRRFRSERSSA